MNALSVKRLRKEYPTFTLDDVCFDVPIGAIVGFIGRNGAGKSTTIKSVLGLVHPNSGDVTFFGRDTITDEKYFKENVGIALCGVDFYAKKKIKIITRAISRFYRNWDDEKYNHYCKLFCIDENKTFDQLSSGMRVKYLIALALSHNAKLLILDEPTSGLDPVSRDELVELFKLIVKDGTRSILFSTHITSDLDKCADRIVFIKDGVIVYSGTKNGFLSEYSDKGKTLEDIIVALERRPLNEGAII